MPRKKTLVINPDGSQQFVEKPPSKAGNPNLRRMNKGESVEKAETKQLMESAAIAAVDPPKKKREPKQPKARGKKIGSIPAVLAGEADEAPVKAEKSELTKRQINAYRAELKRKQEKLDALARLLDSHEK